MGVFEFVIVLVLISTVGKVLSDRQELRAMAKIPPKAVAAPTDALIDTVEDLNTRLRRLEEERDFYQNLLESPDRPRGLEPPADSGTGSGSS